MGTKRRDYNIAVLERALGILESFVTGDPGGISLSDLSRQLGLTVTRTFRILSTLESLDYVRQDPTTRRYRLGLKPIALGERARKGFKLVDVAAPILTRLAAETGETVFLGIVDGREMLCIDRRESIHSIRLAAEIGQRMDLHTGGVAKTLLAFQSPEFIKEYVQRPLARVTELTITDPLVLDQALHEIRRRNVCITRGDLEDGACSIAAPIRNHNGVVVAAVSVAGPDARFGDHDIPPIIAAVQAAAADISRRLGWIDTNSE